MRHMTHADLTALEAIAAQDPNRALILLRQYEIHFAGDENFENNKAGLYIDLGSDLEDAELVEHGIRLLESSPMTASGEHTTAYLYNLANAYSALHALERPSSTTSGDLDFELLVRAKNLYRAAIAVKGFSGDTTHADLWINYASCLSALGRSVEAVDAYNRALRLDHNHPIALGNLGIELGNFAHIAPRRLIILDALEMLERALDNPDLERHGGQQARRLFTEAHRSLQEEQAQAGIGSTSATRPGQPEPGGIPGEYISFGVGHGLFLNFCLDCRRCEAYAEDSLTFSLMAEIPGDQTFIRLSRIVNTMKERYAFARFLLFQARRPLIDTLPVDQMTTYLDNMDYAVYGTQVACLKTALESGYGILDVIAHLVSSYLKLPMKAQDVSFSTVWSVKAEDRLRDEIRELNNNHLRGLYDISRDLYLSKQGANGDGYWGHLRRLRNRQMHEYLIPHVEGICWDAEPDGADCHGTYSGLIQDTFDVLQLVRAAIIHTMSFLIEEERKKSASSDRRVLTIPVKAYDAKLYHTRIGVQTP